MLGKMKHPIDALLSELPEPYKSKALKMRNNKIYCHPTSKVAEDVAHAILIGFTWAYEPKFWSDVYEKVKVGGVQSLPQPKPEPKKVELSPNAQSVLRSLKRRQMLRPSSYSRGVLRKAVRELRAKGYEITEIKGRQFRHGKGWRTEDVFVLQ